MKRRIIVVDRVPVILPHLCQRLRHGCSGKFGKNIWRPEQQNHKHGAPESMSFHNPFGKFPKRLLRFSRNMADPSDQKREDPAEQQEKSGHHPCRYQQMKAVHPYEIPRIRITKTVSEYHKKGTEQCRYPIRPSRQIHLPFFIRTEKKDKHQKSQNCIPVIKDRKIFQLFNLNSQNRQKTSCCRFFTDSAQICVQRHQQRKTDQYRPDPILYLFFFHSKQHILFDSSYNGSFHPCPEPTR